MPTPTQRETLLDVARQHFSDDAAKDGWDEEAALERIRSSPGLSKDVTEVVSRALA
jgi:hypothetical protein